MEEIYLMDVSPLADCARYAQACDACSPQRREKLAALGRQEDRLRSLGAAVLLDAALQRRGLRERDVRYEFSDRGKPCIPALPDFRFSISHAGRLVACAVSVREAGVDVEYGGRMSETLIRRCFTAAERRAADPLRLWTLKESYGKLTGRGLAVMRETELRFGAAVQILDGGETAAVTFQEFVLRDGARLALCCRGCEPPRAELIWIGGAT